MSAASTRVPAPRIRAQIVSVLRAWSMAEPHAETTAEMMVETDLRGVDSHGISMLPTYDRERRAGRLNMRPVFRTVREGPAFALIDGDASLGHPVAVQAMNLAVDKCRASGVAVASVFNSHHFGAAGCYARIAADRGVIGLVTASTRGVTLVPTFAAEPVLGTNPLAFAAPARRNAPFLLDMATTTVAAGQVKVHRLNHRALPAGWVVDAEGRAVTDADAAFGYVFDRPEGGITPLGGQRESGGHKGYGLAVMVHILAGTLSGASFSPIRNRTQKPSDPHNIGHFFLAIDPRAFRAEGAFEDDLDQVIDVLHGARRADPAQPVLVAGDPELATRVERLRDGVPVPEDLMAQLREVAGSAGVPFVESDTLQAERLLQDKLADPLAAAIGAYALLRVARLDHLHDWTDHLHKWFPWLADGAAIRAEHLARLGRHAEAAQALFDVHARGLPLFADGFFYAVERLKGYAGLKPEKASGIPLERIRSTLAAFQPFASFLHRERPNSSFPGLDPLRPAMTAPPLDFAAADSLDLGTWLPMSPAG